MVWLVENATGKRGFVLLLVSKYSLVILRLVKKLVSASHIAGGPRVTSMPAVLEPLDCEELRPSNLGSPNPRPSPDDGAWV